MAEPFRPIPLPLPLVARRFDRKLVRTVTLLSERHPDSCLFLPSIERLNKSSYSHCGVDRHMPPKEDESLEQEISDKIVCASA